MIIQRKALMNVLSALFPVMGKGADNPCNMITVFADTENNWYMGVTNNRVAMVLPLCFKMEHGFKVHGLTFFQLIKKLKCEELDITVNGNTLSVKTDIPSETSFELVQSGRTMLDFVSSIDSEFKELPIDFMEGLKECVKYTDTDSTSILQYVYMDKDLMASANSSEIFIYKMEGVMDKMFIASEDIAILSTMNLKEYAYQDALLYFRTEGGAFVVVRPASRKERFPVLLTKEDYTHIEQINMKGLTPEVLFDLTDTRKLVFTEDECKHISDIVKSCQAFTGTDGEFSCKFDGYDMCITGKGRKGTHKQQIKLTEFVSPISFETKPELFLDLLERKDTMYIGKGKVIIVNDKTKHLIQVSVGY